MSKKIVLEITLESESTISEFKSDPERGMDLDATEEMLMIAGQCRLPWLTKGIKTIRWKEKDSDKEYEFDTFRLQYDYSNIGQQYL